MAVTQTPSLRTSHLAHSLAAYVPATLGKAILSDRLPTPGKGHHLLAATLFADISGFTHMSEELESDGPRGAEEVNRVLEQTFDRMITAIHQHGGAISHFYGDAMLVYFPDNDNNAPKRALACAQVMQQLMQRKLGRAYVNRPSGKPNQFRLTLKIGVGYGWCMELVTGNVTKQLEFVLVGPGVDEAVQAEKRGSAGKIIASRQLLQRAGLRGGAAFRAVTERVPMFEPCPILVWEEFDEAQKLRLVETLRPFLPSEAYRHLSMGHARLLADHRPVTSLFVGFEGVAYASDDADKLLHMYYEWASELVLRYGGRNSHLNRLLTGDKGNQLHIFFGAPVAPDVPEQAVRCALALQREKPSFIKKQRIGLAAGRVFAGPVGSEARAEYTIVGDVVNLSARLMGICPAGGVMMNEVAAKRVGRVIQVQEMPAVSLKGKQDPVRIFLAMGEQMGSSQLDTYFSRWEMPIVGREQELDQLISELDKGLRGQGGVTTLSGPMGIGKTRLLSEGVHHWLENGGQGMLGICYQHSLNTPFSLWLPIWQDIFQLSPDMSPTAQASKVLAYSQSLCPKLADDAPLWGEVIGLPIPLNGKLAKLKPVAKKGRIFQLILAFLRKVALARPLLLVLEDVHFADQTSVELLDFLAIRLEKTAFSLLVSFQTPTDFKAALLRADRATHVKLLPFALAQAQRFVELLTGEPHMPLEVEVWLGLRDKEGRESPVNPFFLEEAVRLMEERAVLRHFGERVLDKEGLLRLPMPDSIYGLMLARLDQLPADNRALLQVAAVIGRQFDFATLAKIVVDWGEDKVWMQLRELTEGEITKLVSSEPDLVYLFYHALTREVAYESLPYARRQAFHKQIASMIKQRHGENLTPHYMVLTHHYGQAGDHKLALKYALLAAENAGNIYANQEAIEYYTLAETHLPEAELKQNWRTAWHLYFERGRTYIHLGELKEAERDLTRALAIAETFGETWRKARTLNTLAELRYRQSDSLTVLQITERVMTLAGIDDTPHEKARAYLWAGWAHSALLAYDTSLSQLELGIQICLQTEDKEMTALLLEATAYAHYMQKALEPALEAMFHGVMLSRQFNSPRQIGAALNNIALIQFELGRADEALLTFDEAVEVSENASQLVWAGALVNRAGVLCYLGRFELALDDFKRATALLAKMDSNYTLVEAHLQWGYAYHCERKEWSAAAAHFTKVYELIVTTREAYVEERIRLLIGMARVALNAGTPNGLATTFSLLKRANQDLQTNKMVWWQPAVAYYWGLAFLKKGDVVAANMKFDEAVRAVAENGNPDYLPLVLLEMGKLETVGLKRRQMLRQCYEAAKQRSRFTDKQACLQAIAQIDPSILR